MSERAESTAGEQPEPTAVGEPPRGMKTQASLVRRLATGRPMQLASAALGAALLVLALRRRSRASALLALVGGWLVYRSAGGNELRARTALKSAATGQERHEPGAPADAMEVERSITVGKPADELYELWRDPEHLAHVMEHFADVEQSADDEDLQHWSVRGPLGRAVSWDARIEEDRPGEYLSWKSLEGADLPNEGSVQFEPAPGDRGTEVTVYFRFDPPGGAVGNAAAKRLGIVPETVALKSLRRFKSLAESGEIPTLEKNPSARGSGDKI